MVGLVIVGVVLLLVVGAAMLVGNHLMEKAVHKDAHEQPTHSQVDASDKTA
ncbi:hypothetical protein NZD89_27255 [Alicyclobacillus fastidiosus]|uniref:YtzI protein n=1 Tax=Alicyclobacillus fastidiosus TaxID=392011 RepID=A0ABY6ZIW8_9BACL|nr:hypothetical protein [Alicyclobacillus fastidiosus]WAH41855.1 hypothetical protein NZD89_27255 [Alicyclobacillus fastidiosus]GMA63559.1 hypothetical protein GCM10025859_39990 [Alicyclobacillus fastidiosus]